MLREFELREQKRRRITRWGLAFFVILAAVVLLSVRVTKFEVRGNTRYTDEELVSMIYSGNWDTNSLYGFLKDKLRPHKEIPFVERYQVNWRSPFSVEIIVYEKGVVGYVDYMSSHMYFDKDGIIVESTGKLLEGVPRIVGLNFGSIVLYEPLPVADKQVFGDILNLTGALSAYGIQCDEISYDKLLHATLYIDELEVSLGGNEDMELKISTLNDMLPKLSGLSGELDLSAYSENSGNERYIFKKK